MGYMKIVVKAKTGQKTEAVLAPPLTLFKSTSTALETYIVKTKARPIGGKANEAIIQLLAKYFKVPKTSVVLVLGAHAKQKVFEINLGHL
jgi:uncharacterized protein YggU (UPF0235/DUF167 family)